MKKKQRETIKKALCIAAGLVLTAGCLPDAQTLFPYCGLRANAVLSGPCGVGMRDEVKERVRQGDDLRGLHRPV